jgi:phage terminase Nu1 subunit (DNA packaging protein)
VIPHLPVKQSEFAAAVGISQPAVSDLVRGGVLAEGGCADEWLLAYCHRLREQAAGRYSDGPLDLAQERAALARAQRESVELKNSVLRGEYAAVSMLAEVLATASQAVAERFEHLPGQLRKACPELPAQAIDRAMATIASARNEWVRQTAALVSASVTSTDDDDPGPQDHDDEPRAD